MGFFSSNCKCCGRSILNKYTVKEFLTDGEAWMVQAVAITKDNQIIQGEYDGYGRINDVGVMQGDDPDVYHKACWELAGKPTVFTGGSTYSSDQGYFIEKEDYLGKKPV